MLRLTLSLSVALIVGAALIGCSDDDAAESAKPVSFQGQVDTKLPPEQQAKQAALKKFLNAVLEGVGDAGGLSIYAPGIEYRAKYDDFSGARGKLVRWEFNGQPSGNDVPVALFFDEHATGLVEPEQQRRDTKVFVVARLGNRFSIAPK